jgi:RNA polymerase sigma-70 factor (ECF subfamily)
VTQNSGSDNLLLKGFCAGDEECAERFVQHFRRRLSWIAFQIVRDSGSAEDVGQVTFERAWRNGAKFDPERGTLEAWMNTITRNAARDWVRMKRAIPIDPAQIYSSTSLGSCDLEDRDGTEERRSAIRGALASLSTRVARSVVLAGALEMTALEVAHHEHVPLGTAKSRIRTGKQRLRRELNPLGKDNADSTT